LRGTPPPDFRKIFKTLDLALDPQAKILILKQIP